MLPAGENTAGTDRHKECGSMRVTWVGSNGESIDAMPRRTAAALPGRAANRSAAGTRRRRSRASPSARRIVTGPVRNPARASSEGPCPGPSRTCVPSGHLQPCLPILRITAVRGWRVQRGFLPFPNGPWCDPHGKDRHGRGDRGRVCGWARSTRPNCSARGSAERYSTGWPKAASASCRRLCCAGAAVSSRTRSIPAGCG